ncbi:MAG: hypothetical protein NC293_03100 [Roseburia sp.]|nr:hypothetical protein [Roseburia sp.]
MRRYIVKALAVMAAVVFFLLPHGAAYAASDGSTMTKEVEYQGEEKDKKADDYFPEKIVEDGSTWNLQGIRYETVTEKPVMVSEPVTEIVKSGVVNAGETYIPEETVTKDGITYQLSQTTENEVVTEEGYTQKVSGYSEYNSLAEAQSAPETKMVTATDRRTGKNITMKCSYDGITKRADTWEDTYIDITFVSYDADTFLWNKVTVPKNTKNPLKGYEKELLESVGGNRKNYRIRNVSWNGKAYKNAKGVLCRKARAQVRKKVSHYRVNYSGKRKVEEVKGTVYTSVYTGLKETDSGKRNYTIRAVATYEKQKRIPAAGITIGILLFLLIVVGIIFILKKQKAEKDKAKRAGSKYETMNR